MSDKFQVGDKVKWNKNGKLVGVTIVEKKGNDEYVIDHNGKKAITKDKLLFFKKQKKEKSKSKSAIDEKDCEIEKIEGELNGKKGDVKRLTQLLRECKSRDYKHGKKKITMNELVEIIKKENIDNVRDFLNLFPTTSERVKGDNVTRNHVYEALWIICYAKNIVNSENKQFYKSLEGNDTQTLEEVMKGQVNSGNEGGIADLYFELIDDDKQKGDKKRVDKISCNGGEVGYPQCENKTIKSYKKNLFSSKLYNVTILLKALAL